MALSNAIAKAKMVEEEKHHQVGWSIIKVRDIIKCGASSGGRRCEIGESDIIRRK